MFFFTPLFLSLSTLFLFPALLFFFSPNTPKFSLQFLAHGPHWLGGSEGREMRRISVYLRRRKKERGKKVR
jgi:hypothetical protein